MPLPSAPDVTSSKVAILPTSAYVPCLLEENAHRQWASDTKKRPSSKKNRTPCLAPCVESHDVEGKGSWLSAKCQDVGMWRSSRLILPTCLPTIHLLARKGGMAQLRGYPDPKMTVDDKFLGNCTEVLDCRRLPQLLCATSGEYTH